MLHQSRLVAVGHLPAGILAASRVATRCKRRTELAFAAVAGSNLRCSRQPPLTAAAAADFDVHSDAGQSAVVLVEAVELVSLWLLLLVEMTLGWVGAVGRIAVLLRLRLLILSDRRLISASGLKLLLRRAVVTVRVRVRITSLCILLEVTTKPASTAALAATTVLIEPATSAPAPAIASTPSSIASGSSATTRTAMKAAPHFWGWTTCSHELAQVVRSPQRIVALFLLIIIIVTQAGAIRNL
ncbi:hypothetical protein KC345_g159 [Hortaea werneckii]|nr:hypothetical protein KC345_g159 [Hortaea werneckii]